MRLKIPMTGTVIDFLPDCYKLDHIGIIGDPNDPVRPVKFNLGGIAWRLVGIDLDNDLMEIEASPPDMISIPVLDSNGKPVLDPDGFPVFSNRPTTDAEKQQILANAQNILNSNPGDSAYDNTGDKHLIKPPDVMAKYRAVVNGDHNEPSGN